MNGEQKWWFERKESGFGWGMPTCWQGWVVLVVFIILMAAGIPLVGARYGQTGESLFIVALIAGLLIVLLVKGEPLWGAREGERGQAEAAQLLKSYAVASYIISIIVILLAIPLALRWIPQNPWYGFRIPSSLAGTNEHWLRLNEVAGIAELVAGVISVVATSILYKQHDAPGTWKGPAMVILTLVLLGAAAVCPFLIT